MLFLVAVIQKWRFNCAEARTYRRSCWLFIMSMQCFLCYNVCFVYWAFTRNFEMEKLVTHFETKLVIYTHLMCDLEV